MDIAHLDAILGDARRAFLDSSTCIAFHSTGEAVHPLARHLLQRIESDEDPLSGYLSVVTVAELLVRPMRGASADLTLMHRFLRGIPNLQILDVDFEIAQQAANIRALTRLQLPDSLLIGTALLSGCEVIITNDERWARRRRPLFGQFSWIYLGD
jgi:predicted nucleic acid-binding protein